MRKPLRTLARLAVVCTGLIASPAFSQQAPIGEQVQSSVLIIDNDVLFLNSLYGKRIIAELDEAAIAVQAENDRIVAALVAEESSLTDRRPTMDAEAFRTAATAFDAKAQEFRQERDAARDALVTRRGTERAAFFDRVHPIIGQLMLERNASVVLDRRSVFLAIGSADITQEAIALVNETLGDGSETALPDPVAPEVSPVPQSPPEPENLPDPATQGSTDEVTADQ